MASSVIFIRLSGLGPFDPAGWRLAGGALAMTPSGAGLEAPGARGVGVRRDGRPVAGAAFRDLGGRGAPGLGGQRVPAGQPRAPRAALAAGPAGPRVHPRPGLGGSRVRRGRRAGGGGRQPPSRRDGVGRRGLPGVDAAVRRLHGAGAAGGDLVSQHDFLDRAGLRDRVGGLFRGRRGRRATPAPPASRLRPSGCGSWRWWSSPPCSATG